jgi:hypothetical protein
MCHVFTDLDPDIEKNRRYAYYYGYIRAKIYTRQNHEVEDN